ncbi:MAG TPA: radical SAM protein [Chloroflexia bacterium]|nr:radical SAM protein [Chloroflexia bacterium]
MPRIMLINAPLQSAVCDYGVGHQMPLGLLMIGGPLLDAGFPVALVDAARDHLSDAQIVARAGRFRADIVMTAHVGSTQAHPCCLRLLRAIKAALPGVVTVYGGVHPTYHYATILAQEPQVDIVVRGEGEATALALVQVLATQPPGVVGDLAGVDGIAWRRDGTVVMNRPRAAIQNLDAQRIGWELIDDWDGYRAFGLGRAAVVQFSRGCPHTCTYCGQWMFWKHWRHRRVAAFVDELEWLHREHDVRFFWLADENPTTIKDLWRDVLAEIGRRRLDIGLCASIRAQDIVRDADILPLYKQAGFLYILMGIETVTDATLAKIRKGSSVDDGYRAVQLLRRHQIMSVVDYIFGIEDETPRTIWRGLRGLLRYDGDFVNALYITPHAWTPLGRAVDDAPIVEPDLARWDYRHQILAVPHLSPGQLFLGVKLVELIYHLHPRRLWRALAVPDRRLRRQLRRSFWHTAGVFWYEIGERIADRVRRPRRAHRRALTPRVVRLSPPDGGHR